MVANRNKRSHVAKYCLNCGADIARKKSSLPFGVATPHHEGEDETVH